MLFKKEKLFSKDNGSGATKNIITLTGESGTLTAEQIAQVLDDTAVLEIVCDGEVFRLSNKDSTLTYRTFINADCALNENVSFKVIYVQLNPEAVNYGAWTLEEVSSGLPDPTGLADGTYVLKLVIADGVPTLSWVVE